MSLQDIQEQDHEQESYGAKEIEGQQRRRTLSLLWNPQLKSSKNKTQKS